jgi:alpha-ketoglutarate-dependent taurine dioxygenase
VPPPGTGLEFCKAGEMAMDGHWQPGDLVVWDEVMALHRAPDDFGPHHRKVIRVTAGRQVPTAAS